MSNIIKITPDELDKFTSPYVYSRKKTEGPPPKQTVFLSTSFKQWAQVAEQSRLMKDVFNDKFNVVGGWDFSGGGQLSKILRAIRKSDIVLTDVTYLSANIMIELGMAYWLADSQNKRVFLFFNSDAPKTTMHDLPLHIRSLDIMTYQFNVDSLRLARDKIYERVQTEAEPEELMKRNIRGSTLRPRHDSVGVFVYYPIDRKIWDQITIDLRKNLEEKGLKLYTWIGAPSGSTRLEEIIYNVSRSSKELAFSCFVDTTAATSVDFVGAFALGAATAASKRGVGKGW